MTKQGDTTVLSEPYMYVSPATGVTSTQVYRYRTTTATGNSTWYYSYDQNGNITYVDSSAFGDVSYQYDSQGQLLWEYSNVTYYATQWEYDDAGNILSRKVYDYYFDEIDSLYRSDTYSYTDTQWGDLLTGYNGRTITYDGIGNPVNDGIWTYAWQHGRQLASMTSGSTTWTYTYNADGLRTKKTDGTNTYTYIYNGSKLTAMTKGSNTLYFTYDASGTPLAVNYNNATYYYTVNLQGDILGIVDNSGNTVATYAYDAWGNLLSVSGSMASTLGIINPLRYRGYVYDTETRLYYLQSRYYNPEWGRFINADGFVTTGQGFVGNNMFAYCGNNPITFVDYTGDLPWLIIPIIIIPLLTGCSQDDQVNHQNCYAYAFKMDNDPRTGKPFTSKPQPGEFSGDPLPRGDLRLKQWRVQQRINDRVRNDMYAMGMNYELAFNADQKTRPGNWLVALAYDPELMDYHWWRRDENGTWSHKRGLSPVEYVDSSGNVITDPATCDRGGYTHFLGYYQVGPN